MLEDIDSPHIWGEAGSLVTVLVRGGAEIARPDKTAPDQTARLNNRGHKQSSPWRIITAE